MESAMMPQLSDKERRFVEEYLKDLNGSAAARRMGYAPNSAATVAYRMLRTPAVRRVVAEACTGDVQNPVIAELRAVAFAQGSDENGAPVKLASKLRALELLGKHMGLFEGGGGRKTAPVTIIEDV